MSPEIATAYKMNMLAMMVLFCYLSLADAKLFLKLQKVSQTEADASLSSELMNSGSNYRIEDIQESLRQTYVALQENTDDRVSHQAVRYLLHRFFVQQHGWYIKGLEPGGDSFRTSPSQPIMAGGNLTDWVPSYLQSRLEERVGQNGIDLREIAILAATLEDLVKKEAASQLEDVYNVLNLPTTGTIKQKDAEDVIDTYMMIYLVGRNVSLSNPIEAAYKRKKFALKYKGYTESSAWLNDLKQRHIDTAAEGVDFSVTTRIVQEIGEQYGAFNDLECRDLKKTLMKMEWKRASRVRLADFYNASLYTHWKFTEKLEFLRANGALDESNEKSPALIIPNYVSSYPNCLKATTLYAVCCRNECEDLMKHLEHAIGRPSTDVEHIVKLVTALGSDTVPAPRKLSERLLNRLQEMADLHGGKVILHGRLFAQWMHHAFPRECPYPHEAGLTNPQTADEWMLTTGQSSTHVEEHERRKIVEDACAMDGAHDGESEDQELPWTEAEEVLVVLPPPTATPSYTSSRLFVGLFCMITVGALQFSRRDLVGNLKQRRVLMLASTIVLAYDADLLDTACFVCSIIGALAFFVACRFRDQDMPEMKCCV